MNSWTMLTVAAAVAALVLALRDMQGPDQVAALGDPWAPSPGPDDAWMPSADQEQDTVSDQLPTVLETFQVAASEAVEAIPQALGLGAPEPSADQAARNVAAFLDMLAYSEGTGGPNGYRTLFGGGLVDNLADHPRQFFTFTDKAGRTQRTSAAGRYQFLSRTWDALAAKLGLVDFGPASQDAAAIELIRERGALADVRAGNFAQAVAKCAPTWASLPGAGYNQPERNLRQLIASYQAAGGTIGA